MKHMIIRIINAAESGGIRQSEFQYSARLVQRGYHVVQIILNDADSSFPHIEGVRQVRVSANIQDYRGKPFHKLKAFALNHSQRYRDIVKQVSEVVDNVGAEVLAINTRKVIQVPLALALGKRFNCQVLFHPGDSNHNKSGLIKKYYLALKKNPRIRFIANSKNSAESFGLNASQHVYPGFDSSRFSELEDNHAEKRAAKRAELGLADDAPLLLFMARVEIDKAPDILIDAFYQANVANDFGAKLALVGVHRFDDAFIQGLQQQILRLGLEDHVILKGYSTDVAGWFSAADVFVNSRRGVEPFGISIVEAMHCGLPVLSSGYGGPTETVQEGKTGWLVRDLSVEGYIGAIKQAFAEHQNWPKMRVAARAASQQFDVDAQVERYLKFVHASH